MSINSRLAKLEARNKPAPNSKPRYSDAEHNRSMDILAEAVRAEIIAKLDAAVNGDPMPAQDPDPATQALRDEILSRLNRIAEASHVEP